LLQVNVLLHAKQNQTSFQLLSRKKNGTFQDGNGFYFDVIKAKNFRSIL